MSSRVRHFISLLRQSAKSWVSHDASRLGAALAFYTIFAIAPLFVIVLAVAGALFGEEAANRQLFDQLAGLVGEKGAEAIQAMVAAADRPAAGIWATVVAIGTLFVGATGVFVHLQAALNKVWDVKREEKGIKHFIKDRMLSFAMVLAIGFLLLVSLVISASLSALGELMSGFLPAQEILWKAVNFVISLGVITVLFALIFKILPDARVGWRNVWLGALITALLFNLGKALLSIYLGRASFMSAYGAAGSLVLILVWVYYSSQIMFFGAEFTRLCAKEACARPAASEAQPQRSAAGKRPAKEHNEDSGKSWHRRLRSWFESRFSEKTRKVIVAVTGSLVILAGVMMLFFPGPAFIVIPAGFAILSLEFRWARRWYDKTKDWMRSKGWLKGGGKEPQGRQDTRQKGWKRHPAAGHR